MNQPKVFEFAKEIGMETIALMDKIKEWKLPVKSHMALLTDELINEIKQRLEGEISQTQKATKKVAKVAKKASSTTKKVPSSSKKVVVAKPISLSKKKSIDDSLVTPVSASESQSLVKSDDSLNGGSRVLRKKSGAVLRKKTEINQQESVIDHQDNQEDLKESAVETVSQIVVSQSQSQSQSGDPSLIEREIEIPLVTSQHSIPSEKKEATKGEESIESSLLSSALETERAESIDSLKPIIGVQTNNSSQDGVLNREKINSKEVPDLKTAPLVHSSPFVQTSSSPVSSIPAAAPTQQTSVSPSGVVSTTKKVVKRNIVGKIDLSRVRPPSHAQGSGGYGGNTSGSSYSGGSRSYNSNQNSNYQNNNYQNNTGSAGSDSNLNRPKRSGTRSVRTGFVAPVIPDLIPPTDDFFGKNAGKDKVAKRKVFTSSPSSLASTPSALANPSANAGKEEPIKNFTASDFRKREVIFQPKKKKPIDGDMKKTQITVPKAHKRVVKIHETIKLDVLAQEMGLKASALTKVLIQNGVMANMNTELDFETVSLIVPEFGWEAENVHKTADVLVETHAFGDLSAEPIPRAPVVTIMGHVDHGKTTLLDAIRKANVAAGEAGGITQHIGAYRVTLEDGSPITFLDTPGHAAFTAMRARGAHVTDIVVIVVAADDGLMPQTEEAISHAQAAGVPIIVAVNKMDKPQANPDQVKKQLADKGLLPEEWGGETIFVPVSALKGTGVKELLEQINVTAEMQELKANPFRSARGVVIESAVKKGKGSVATLLIQEGTLRLGESIVVGKVSGRVRQMLNDRGEAVKEALPGVPVEITGLSGTPDAGDRFDVCADDASAAQIALVRIEKEKKESSGQKALSVEELLSKVKGSQQKELSIVLKTDVVGSSEAIKGMFEKIEHAEVKVKVIHAAVGPISESDVLLASTASGLIFGFNIRPDSGALALSKEKHVEIKTYSIIYELLDDIKARLSGMLAPDVVEKIIGRAEVREVFAVPKIGTIAGCMVVDGKIARTSQARLIRNGRVIYQGLVSSLKRFKDDAREVASGYECGIGIENYNDIKVSDEIEAFVKEEIARTLT